MGTKMAVAFANIFMAKIEKEILRQSSIKPIFWKRFIDDVISVWDTSRNEIEEFLLQANNFHPTIKFYHGWNIRNRDYILGHERYKGVRFNKDSILDVRTHFKPTETFQYTNFYSCHPPGVTKGFIKGEALSLLRTNSPEITFEENIRNFSTRLKNRDYPATTVEKPLSEVIFPGHFPRQKKSTRTEKQKWGHQMFAKYSKNFTSTSKNIFSKKLYHWKLKRQI